MNNNSTKGLEIIAMRKHQKGSKKGTIFPSYSFVNSNPLDIQYKKSMINKEEYSCFIT